jgi:hypothetical protein
LLRPSQTIHVILITPQIPQSFVRGPIDLAHSRWKPNSFS